MSADIPTLTRGDTSPALTMTIGDARQDADFSTLTAADVKVQATLDGVLKIDSPVTSFTPAADTKSATIRRAWGSTDTDTAGHMWIRVYVVPWKQHFPDDGALRLDIEPAPGDA